MVVPARSEIAPVYLGRACECESIWLFLENSVEFVFRFTLKRETGLDEDISVDGMAEYSFICYEIMRIMKHRLKASGGVAAQYYNIHICGIQWHNADYLSYYNVNRMCAF